MYLGYNTNGMAFHALDDAIKFLKRTGYQGIAITLDTPHVHVNRDAGSVRLTLPIKQLATLLTTLKMHSVIETGARFILDPEHKHEPTLLSPDPEKQRLRQAYYYAAIRLGKKLGSECVSIWSGGIPEDTSDEKTLWSRLTLALIPVLKYAHDHGIRIALEPEPGMFIDITEKYARLRKLLAQKTPIPLFLTLDIGHLHCMGESIPDTLFTWRKMLINIHLEDMRYGIHEHLMFGEGEICFQEVFSALNAIRYKKGVYVELSRHSHDAHHLIPEVMKKLNIIIKYK